MAGFPDHGIELVWVVLFPDLTRTMTTHFIDVEIDLNESPIALPQAIEAELQKRGEPLRWAVADVESDRTTEAADLAAAPAEA